MRTPHVTATPPRKVRAVGVPAWWALALLLVFFGRPSPAAAEWHIKPFLGLTFAGGTTFVDPEAAAGSPNVVYGVTGVLLGEVIGVEGDFGRAPGFFQEGDKRLLIRSEVTTLTGNFVFALPRRMTEYTLRPYVVAGAGLMHVEMSGRIGAVEVSSTLPALNLGGGVTGFLSEGLGISWDVRHFRSFRGIGEPSGVSFGEEQLSFWRANMAVVFRY